MKPLKSAQIKDYIVEMLQNEVFSGALQDGTELAQEDLAEKLGVSRMPVREALQQLESEGVLRRLPNRHVQVNGITPVVVAQQFAVLAAMESSIGAMLIRENRDLTLLEEAHRRYSMAVPLQGKEECAGRELEFHRQISCCLGNPYLSQIHEKMLSGYFSYALYHTSREWKATLKLLNGILQALEQKDMTGLGQLLQMYFDEVARAAMGGNVIE